MIRSSFLLFMLMSSSASSSTAFACMNMSVKRVKVAIVGAGAAGLQASRLLCEAGVESVLLLEARDRVGGRIHTTTCKVGDQGATIQHDEGAAWVHGIGYDWPATATAATTANNGTTITSLSDNNTNEPKSTPQVNPMLQLLQDGTGNASRKELFEKELIPLFKRGNPWMRPKHSLFDDDQLAVFVNGQLTSDNMLKKSLDRHWKIMDEVDDVGQTLTSSGREEVTLHQSLHETLERVLKKKDIVRHKRVYGKDFKTMEALRQFYVHLIEVWYAGSAENLQLQEFMGQGDERTDDWRPRDEDYSGEGDFYGPHCTIESGMSSILKPLMSHGEEILTQQEVTKIRHSQGGKEGDMVVLETKSGLVVHADACIVTIPLACLKVTGDALFEPKLSVAKQESLDILRVGHYKKVFLTFDHIFWPAEPAFVGFLLPNSTSPLGKHLLADNLWARNGLACLEVVLVADAVAWANDKPTEQIRDAVLDFLRDAMDESGVDTHKLCTDCKVTRWEEDPYSLGAYSTFGTGCDEKHTISLRAPEWDGRLTFAGEHTISEFEGSVHAALFSGYDSSKAVLEFLKK